MIMSGLPAAVTRSIGGREARHKSQHWAKLASKVSGHTVSSKSSQQTSASRPGNFIASLRNRRADEAVIHFQKLLQEAQQPRVLEKCLQDFARYRQYKHMLKALNQYILHGYSPSITLWTRVLQVASLAETAATDIRPYLSKGLTEAISDEDSLQALLGYCARFGLVQLGEDLFERYAASLSEDAGSIAAMPPGFWAVMIDGRGRMADFQGAVNWFLKWRDSPGHPSKRHDLVNTVHDKLKFFGRSITLPSGAAPRVLLGWPVPTSSLQLQPRLAHTLPHAAAAQMSNPSPLPYLSLLKHTRLLSPARLHKLSHDILQLMAADRVPLVTDVINGIMQNEHRLAKPGSMDSILALYEKLRENQSQDFQANHATFYQVFRAYREPRQGSTSSHNPYKPTQLARLAELPLPSTDLTDSPRRVFRDMLQTAYRHQQVPDSPPFITPDLIEEAIGAFVRNRDFVGCAAALKMLRVLLIEPTARLHSKVTLGLLRARDRREAFAAPLAGSTMSDDEALRLRKHIRHISALCNHRSPLVVRVHRIASQNGPAATLISCDSQAEGYTPETASLQAKCWNGRTVPRTDAQVRYARKYELRYLQPLHELLSRASDASPREWDAEVANTAAAFKTTYFSESRN